MHELCEKGDRLKEVRAYVDMHQNISGGTVETMYLEAANSAKRDSERKKQAFDPLLTLNASFPLAEAAGGAAGDVAGKSPFALGILWNGRVAFSVFR